MNTTTYSDALLPLAGTDASAAVAAKPGILSRLMQALIRSREMQASREIARIELIMGRSLRSETQFTRNDLPFQG